VSDLHWLTATAAAEAIAARKLSPVELTTALLNRIGRLDPTLHAFIRLDAEAAIAAARAAEAEAASGRLRGPLVGWAACSAAATLGRPDHFWRPVLSGAGRGGASIS